MYSTNTNNQQDRGRQALNVKPAPWGGHYIIHIEDVITDTGKHGLSIYNETLREADHETPASRVDTLLKTTRRKAYLVTKVTPDKDAIRQHVKPHKLAKLGLEIKQVETFYVERSTRDD